MTKADLKVLQLFFESIRDGITADIIDSPRLELKDCTMIPVSEVINIVAHRLRVNEEALKGGEDK